MHYGVVDRDRNLVHYIPIELPGPRLPHDMAFTENYAILNDFPLFWDPEALKKNAHAVRFFEDMPSRFAILPRRGTPDQIRWFEANPTFVLHWINAYEDGDEIILDGYYENNPSPDIKPDPNDLRSLFRTLDVSVIGAGAYRWRFNLVTGEVKEGPLDDQSSEFGMINQTFAGKPYQYVWSMTNKPGWFLFDGMTRLNVQTGEKQIFTFPDGVFASESPMAPKLGAADEDDGYVVTYVSDMNTNSSAAWIFDATDITTGPIARLSLPERICSGTHSWWAGQASLTGE